MIRILVNNMVACANINLDDNKDRVELPHVCKHNNNFEQYQDILNQGEAIEIDWLEFNAQLRGILYNNSLNLAARMMILLNHSFADCFSDCDNGSQYISPYYAHGNVASGSDMFRFINLIKQAEKWNNGRDHQFSCVSWLTGDENVLQHTTTSGRMEVEVRYNEIVFKLNSPSMPDKPYCTVRFTNGLDMCIEIESGIDLTISRLSPIVDILQCLNFSRLNAWKWLQNRGSRKLARAARKGEIDHFNYMLRNACDKALSTSYNDNDRCEWDAKTFEDAWQYIPDDKRYKRFAKTYFAQHFLNPKNKKESEFDNEYNTNRLANNDDIIARLDALTQD